MNKEPRLKFTKEERSAPELKKAIHKVDKATKKADKAQAKLQKKGIKRSYIDPKTGKVKTKLTNTVKNAPVQTIISSIHGEIEKSEDENLGVQSTHKSEKMLETGVHLLHEGYKTHKLKPYRKAVYAERELEKANINALYKKSLYENPQLSSNPLSRFQQKQAIKKQYANAKRANQTANNANNVAQNAKKAARTAKEKSKQAIEVILRHKKSVLVVLALFMMICIIGSSMSSCTMIAQSIGSAVSSSTYPSKDQDMLDAEATYSAKEAELQSYLDNYESTHSYDEYHYDLDEIGHDPYVLISLLTAYHGGEWTLSEVQSTLDMLFEKQYKLTEEVIAETRHDSDGNSYTYYICYVTLENFDLSHLPVYILNEQQMSMYAVYMSTLGNRPDLFPQNEYPNASVTDDFLDYDVPPEALEDEQFANMIKEAEKYLGYPYVWGGSYPSTSFDCSGFVSWVINNCGNGWNVGRLTANGLLGICTPVSSANAKAGDLIFFKGTYNTSGASHVGIYVGGNYMIHCGDPISYADISSSYWQSHFYTFGRLP